MKLTLNLTLVLYLFILFNREFVPFIDIRVLIMVFFLLLIGYKIVYFFQYGVIGIYGRLKYIVLFMFFVFLIFFSNLSWYWNPFPPNAEVRTNIILIYIFNLLSIVVFYLYWNKIDLFLVKYAVLLSGAILFLSMLSQYFGFMDLPFQGKVRGQMLEELSIFGVRVGGYAEDPNYASLGMIIWAVTVVLLFESKTIKVPVIVLAVLGLLLSFSKTIIVALFLFFCFWLAKRLRVFWPFIFFIAMAFMLSFFYLVNFLDTLSTMSIRFRMWHEGFLLFLQSPFIGSGISSVRSNFDFVGGWYVQPHSSLIVLMADTGIFSLLIYLVFIYLSFFIDSLVYKLFIFIILFISLTQDILVLQYPYYALLLLLFISLKKGVNRRYVKLKIKGGL